MDLSAPSKLLLLGSSSFRTFRNIWMLEELQVPFQHEFMKARPQSRGAKQYHPLGKVPSLVVTEQSGREWSMYESTAINTYLGDTYGALIPHPKTPERVKYDQTVAFCLSELDAQGLWIHRKHESLGSSTIFGEAPQAVVEAKRQFYAANQVMIDQLSHSVCPLPRLG
jgi:glutathione S-transferase